MLKKWTSLYQFTFQHGEDTYEATANLLSYSDNMIVFTVYSTFFGMSPARFAFCSYNNSHWLVDLDEEAVTYIQNPNDPDSSTEDLLAVCSDDDQADELAYIIRTLRFQHP